MKITGRENLNRAIEFKGPEYLPVELGFEERIMHEKNPGKVSRIMELSDQLTVDLVNPSTFVHHVGELKIDGEQQTWVDEWGTGWEDDGFGTKAVSSPLEGGYELLKGYDFPKPEFGPHIFLSDVYENRDPDLYVRPNVWFTLFERFWMLRGYENTLMDPYSNLKEFEGLRDRIVEFNLKRIDYWLEYDIDGIFFSDDWGTQRGTLISLEDWRKLYKPSYRKMYDRVRAAGKHVWMHSCGDVLSLIPDLIDLGVNVLNPIQPQAMDVRELAGEYGGQLCFHGGADVQGTLVNGSTEDVKNEVYMLADVLGRFNGGYIGATSHTIMPETPLDNIIAMYEAFIEVQGR